MGEGGIDEGRRGKGECGHALGGGGTRNSQLVPISGRGERGCRLMFDKNILSWAVIGAVCCTLQTNPL